MAWFIAIASAGCWGGAGLILGQLWHRPTRDSDADPFNLVLGVALLAIFGVALVVAIGFQAFD